MIFYLGAVLWKSGRLFGAFVLDVTQWIHRVVEVLSSRFDSLDDRAGEERAGSFAPAFKCFYLEVTEVIYTHMYWSKQVIWV